MATQQTPGARLPIVALLSWAVLVFAVPAVALTLNIVDVLAFPLGYFMTSQGVLLLLVLIGWLSLRHARKRAARAAADG